TGGKVACVGYDGRLSSPELEAAAVEGLVSCGLAVRRIGRGPTPMLYYATKVLDAAGGLMVTGSHNPPDHNGFKMLLRDRPFFGADIHGLGETAAAGAFASGGGEATDHPLTESYVERLLWDYDGTRPLSVVWDPGNGAAGEVTALLTGRLPGRHEVINAAIDGTFPNHHPDPTEPENMAQLQEAVRRGKADLGIAFDGDGDRIGVVDDLGRILWGDQILLLLAEDLLRSRPGATIIADVKTSQTFFDEIERMGGKPLMWRTGHSLIKSKMAETGAVLAGEMSGHIFMGDRYYGFDDALYAAVRLLGVASRSGEPLSARIDRLPKPVNTPELRFPCPEERKFAVIDEVKARLAPEVASGRIKVVDIDGVRVMTDDGWWLLRASNTQAVLVARCEAASAAGLERLREQVGLQLRASGLKLP
ncbi:MAG: phosphomannomutase/phosphoglucomutase, partial [Alphaproteobacteria bacterium]|nr:phosphomannomutase/phosphoglucomutase [Alphaproteobacteria bacterium]